ncbi:MAG: gamma carbonic anhydrase family protein [Alphaproteobacteria bacterium]
MKNIRSFKGYTPTIHPSAFIAPTAVIIGRVKIGPRSSVWDGCVLRGDVSFIEIGEETNVQEGTVIHLTSETIGTQAIPTIIGSRVTIGHCALLHACTVGDDAFIGMRSTMLDESIVESGGMLGAGALLTPRKILPSGELWVGNPARKVRSLGPDALQGFRLSAAHYVSLAKEHATELV